MLDDFDFALEDLDIDLDGIPDSIDSFIDLDGSNIPDPIDLNLDLDLDGMPDRLAPGMMDLDGNLIPDGIQPNGPDLDGDYLPDGMDPFLDFDKNGIPDGGFQTYLRKLNLSHPFGVSQ